MKKLMTVFIAILFLLSTIGFCFAQGSKVQPEATPPVGEKDKMTAPMVSKEELQKKKEQQAEKKKAREAKKAEKKKMTKEQKKAKRAEKKQELKEQWKKDREAPKPAPGPAIPVEEKK